MTSSDTWLSLQRAIEFFNGVTDDEYDEALSQATALVTASFEEGFGIPIIESLSMGTPVACSDIPVFREVAGAGAVFFDPRNPSDIAQKVLSLESDGLWEKLSAAAPSHAANYTWDRSAARLLELARSLATD